MRDETPMGTVPFTGYPPARTAQQARRNGCRRTRPMTSGTLCGIGSSLLLQYGPSGQAGRDDVAETSGGGLAEMAIVRIVGRRPFFGDGICNCGRLEVLFLLRLLSAEADDKATGDDGEN